MKTNMLKLNYVIMLFILSLLTPACRKAIVLPHEKALQSATNKVATQSVASPVYQLIWSDEFNTSGSFDTSKWQYCPRNVSAWNKYMTSLPAYASLDGSNLLLKMDNATISGDAVAYHAGGVQSIGKFNITYGKVEVRAKFSKGQGSWPAIWMMPEPATQHAGWPGCGEVDIMEHVNNENIVYQTIHDSLVTNSSGSSSASHSTSYTTTDYNVYAIEWDPSSIKFYVNSTLQYTYSKVSGGGWQQWPFDVPFYIILNQSGGAGWPGAITNANLPFSMQVDYVRVYKLSVLDNGSFEGGTLSPWSAWQPTGGGTATVVTSNVRTGSYALMETGGETSIEQVITGLIPNTTYKFGGYARVGNSGQSALIGVKGYGGSAVDYTANKTSYTLGTVTFTTGASNTSATVYFYKPTSGTAYADDFYLEKQ